MVHKPLNKAGYFRWGGYVRGSWLISHNYVRFLWELVDSDHPNIQ